jgi:chemotaxis signal transduction protein
MSELPEEASMPDAGGGLPLAGLLHELLEDWDEPGSAEEGAGIELAAAAGEESDESPSVSLEELLSRLNDGNGEYRADAVVLEAAAAECPVESAIPAQELRAAAAEPETESEPPAPLMEASPEMEAAGPEAVPVEPEPEATASEPAPEAAAVALGPWSVEEPAAEEPAGDGRLDAVLGAIEREIREAEPVDLRVAAGDGRVQSRYITFTLAGSLYALELERVMETDRIPRSTAVPGTPGFLRGVANLRGEILPLVDLRQLLELGPSEQPGGERMLVVRAGGPGGICGLVVDRLGGMALMERAEMETPPPGDDKLARLLKGIGEHRGRLVGVVDLERLFASGEMRLLAGV